MPVRDAAPLPIPAVPAPAPGDIILPVPFVSQRPFRNLCWAACGEMMFQYLKLPPISLCQIVSAVFGINCCPDPRTSNHDQNVWPHEMYRRLNIGYEIAGGALSPQSVRAWISNMQPIQLYLQWRDGLGSHTALIVGSYANGDLHVHDPQWGFGRQSYQFVLNAYNYGSWQDTWYNIRPIHGPVA